MAVPKGKTSKQRTATRFAHYKAEMPTLIECPHCHELMQAHRVCKNCGYYDKTEVIPEEKKKAK